MKGKRLFISVIAITLFILSQASPTFAQSKYGTSTYINGSSSVYPASIDGSITNHLDVSKSSNLRSGQSPSNINKIDGIPQYKTTSIPAYAILGWGFSGDWNVSHDESSGDSWYLYEDFDSVFDTSLNGSIYQGFYYTYNNLITGRSRTVTIIHAIIYNGVSNSITQLYNVNS